MGNPKTIRLPKIRRVPKIPGGPDIGPASSKLGPVHLKKALFFNFETPWRRQQKPFPHPGKTGGISFPCRSEKDASRLIQTRFAL